MLLGEIGNGQRRNAGKPAGIGGRQDGSSRLPRAHEIAGHPDRIGRQLAREDAEDLGIAAVAVEVALAVDAAAVRDRGVPDPPPARDDRSWQGHGGRAQSIVTTILPMALREASRLMASPARARG
jgi:hypothetical protein